MFTVYKIISLTILMFFLLTLTLVPLYSSMVTIKSMKGGQEELRLNVVHSEDKVTPSYY
jgi:hypothetical protein